MKTIILLLGIFALNQTIAKDKIYKWTDANGNVHFSQKKPQNTKVKEVKVSMEKSTPKVINKDTSNDTSETPETPETKTKGEKAFDDYNKKEKERVRKYQAKENCKIAKKNLATFQSTTRVRKIDPTTGESTRMDDKQRLAALKAAKKLVSGVCK